MARISELHYSNALATNSGVSEFLEVALGPLDDPADFTVSFYQDTGVLGFEITLDDPRITVTTDPDNGEVIYVLSADNLPILLTDPDGGGATNFEAYALTETGTTPAQVIDFYDIGGGTQNITALSGAAAGAVSDNVQPPTGPQTATTTIQWNQPNPDTIVFETISAGDTGVACFTTGTMIDTPDGPRLIESFQKGDLVETLDHGPQPVRWIGMRTVAGVGDLAPIKIAAGTLGALQDTLVSPRHRILVSGWRAELLFGADEVLIAAKDLVNDQTVRPASCARVTYIHLLFDDHQIVETQGMLSESFLPGGYIVDATASQTREELLNLFPDLRSGTEGYGPAARRICTGKEAELIMIDAI
ncbi:Hint domain-containing protein [uncultured Sulfitobacter sp.]|uniref:Hint domain-containing protein n=1 Tax=uncultured Sulfitobacter sp. TaxID=191468 RepID=UPI0026259B87|nr:Hint domain-containing protein [uncultured Sulfitobacter sp.]